MRVFAFLLFVAIVGRIHAQCTIVAKREACVNDLVSFSVDQPSSVVSYNWNFAAYGNSTNSSPLVKFTAQGKVLVTCTMQLSSGQSCSDTHTISILPNPRAKAVLSVLSDSCVQTNQICLDDSITIGSRGIRSLNLLWGDGDILQTKQPIPKLWCHTL